MSFKQLIFAGGAILVLGATVPDSPMAGAVNTALLYIKQLGSLMPVGF